LLRDQSFVQLTRDQTLATLLLERGQLTLDQLDSFELGHVILQALGHVGGVDVDLRELRLADGDTLLMCSDGLHGCVTNAEVSAVLRAHPPSQACDLLVQLALAAGAPDNLSCLVARVTGVEHAPGIRPQLEQVCLPPDEPPSPSPSAPDSTSEGALARLRAFFHG
jgi:serine/threonine protein phosphatase PrpC